MGHAHALVSGSVSIADDVWQCDDGGRKEGAFFSQCFVGNVRMGASVALTLGLDLLYEFMPGVAMTNEVWAGLFEAMVGALQRAGLWLFVEAFACVVLGKPGVAEAVW